MHSTTHKKTKIHGFLNLTVLLKKNDLFCNLIYHFFSEYKMALILDKIENYSSVASVFTDYHKIVQNWFVKPFINTKSSNLG